MKENAPPEVRGEVGSKTKHADLDHPNPSRKIIKAVLAEVEQVLDRVSSYEYDGYGDHAAELCQSVAFLLRRRLPAAFQAFSLIETEALIADTIGRMVEDALRDVGFEAAESTLQDVRDGLDFRFFGDEKH
jgi:hypothetical protein